MKKAITKISVFTLLLLAKIACVEVEELPARIEVADSDYVTNCINCFESNDIIFSSFTLSSDLLTSLDNVLVESVDVTFSNDGSELGSYQENDIDFNSGRISFDFQYFFATTESVNVDYVINAKNDIGESIKSNEVSVNIIRPQGAN